jgi:hypothetical protein
VQPSDDAWDLLNRLAKVYMSPAAEFPDQRRPGYIVRYSVERVGGVGPWVTGLALSHRLPSVEIRDLRRTEGGVFSGQHGFPLAG